MTGKLIVLQDLLVDNGTVNLISTGGLTLVTLCQTNLSLMNKHQDEFLKKHPGNPRCAFVYNESWKTDLALGSIIHEYTIRRFRFAVSHLLRRQYAVSSFAFM